LTPPQEIIGTILYLGNGTGPLFSANSCPQLQQCLTGHTFLFPITDVQCYGALNQQHAIIGFATAQIDSVDCSDNIIYGHAVGDCSTNTAACPSAGLVK
jgi:hypothetical protein